MPPPGTEAIAVVRQLDGTTRPPVAGDQARAISVGEPMMAMLGCAVLA